MSQSSSEAALTLFEQYGNEIYRYIRFTVGESNAEDILQEVFLQVVKSWDNFKHKSSVKTWLYAITNNCIKAALRRNKFTQNNVDLEEKLHDNNINENIFLIDLEQMLLTQHNVRKLTA
ncbi:hypothetical protein AAC03nite_16890 [Alicyclobacillus acidoterrestris]|uniref:RNA polymerase sigma factor n=1 Tax=Alicyclobacillus suci TaxID=2816080 RepID=UPI00119176CE|nr:sigma-70 family RNA polymerase sigma factor [Alicyclobacillus suci]GEO25904.1 hypothetical protein AAC03nite_16890 [Alicyclobacillus acidoterrestris]